MDGLNLYITVAAVSLGVLSGILTFLRKQVYETTITGLRQDNDDLRKRRDDVIQERDEFEKDNVRLVAENKLLVKQNLQLPKFSDLTAIISNNHTEVIKRITELTSLVVKDSGNGKR